MDPVVETVEIEQYEALAYIFYASDGTWGYCYASAYDVSESEDISGFESPEAARAAAIAAAPAYFC